MDTVKEISIRQSNGDYITKAIDVNVANTDSEIYSALAAKQNKLVTVEGGGINIDPNTNVITATGGGGGSYSRLPGQQGGVNPSIVYDGDIWTWDSDTYRKSQVNGFVNSLQNDISELAQEVDGIVVNNAKLIIKQNGTVKQHFTANQGGEDVEVDIVTDTWVNSTAVTPDSNLKVAFDNLDDNYTYDLYFDDDDSTLPHTVPAISITEKVKSAGTNTNTIKITFTLDGATAGSTKCFLRKIQ